jgi:hypothetical protein
VLSLSLNKKAPSVGQLSSVCSAVTRLIWPWNHLMRAVGEHERVSKRRVGARALRVREVSVRVFLRDAQSSALGVERVTHSCGDIST